MRFPSIASLAASRLLGRRVTPATDETPAGAAEQDTPEWQPSPEPDTLEDGAPKQVLRAASPELMKWLLEKLGALGADIQTLTTHDAVHGLGAKWQAKRHGETGFGYGPPTTAACIRAITAPGQTSLYYFLTQHLAAKELREELRLKFGDDWQRKCFGRATHFLSHSWGMPFAGFISALADVPAGSFVWNDILAINQHGDAGPLARAAMGADLNSLEGVIKHTKRTVLYFHPLDAPAPIKRVWCLYEILTVVKTPGGELTLGFTSSGKEDIFRIAKGFSKVGKAADKDLDQAKKLQKTIETLNSKRAEATVPADEDMIKRKIGKTFGGHKNFDATLREALMSAVMGFASHLELVETGRALAAPKSKKVLDAALKPFLEALECAGKRLIPPDAIDLRGLQSLDLSGKKLTDNQVKGLVQLVDRCKSISSLNVDGHALSIDELKGTKPVESIDLSGKKLGAASGIIIGACIKENMVLKELNVDGHALPIDELKGTKPLESIDLLPAWPKKLGAASGIIIGACIKENMVLKELNVDGHALPIDELKGTKLVKSIDLSGKLHKISVASGIIIAACIKENAVLKELILVKNQLTSLKGPMHSPDMSGVLKLAEALPHSQLTSLSLNSNNLSGVHHYGSKLVSDLSGILKLAKALPKSHLTSLSLDGNALAASALTNNGKDMSGIIKLAEALPHSQLTSLSLADNFLKFEGCKAVAAVLDKTQITSLNIGRNNIGVEGGKSVAAALKETHITNLKLDNNKLTGDPDSSDLSGILKLAKALPHSQLKSLSLADNMLCGVTSWGRGTYTTKGIHALCVALKSTTTLTCLNVCFNGITGDAADNLAKAVLKHAAMTNFCGIPLNSLRDNSITELDIKDMGVGEPGAIVLSKLLPSASALATFNLYGNGLGPDGGAALAKGLKGNTTLKELNMDSNLLCGIDGDGEGEYTAEGITALCEGLKGGALTSLSLANSSLCGLYKDFRDDTRGTYTAEGINVLCEETTTTTGAHSAGVRFRHRANAPAAGVFRR